MKFSRVEGVFFQMSGENTMVGQSRHTFHVPVVFVDRPTRHQRLNGYDNDDDCNQLCITKLEFF